MFELTCKDESDDAQNTATAPVDETAKYNGACVIRIDARRVDVAIGSWLRHNYRVSGAVTGANHGRLLKQITYGH